jgi:hypothetical protein
VGKDKVTFAGNAAVCPHDNCAKRDATLAILQSADFLKHLGKCTGTGREVSVEHDLGQLPIAYGCARFSNSDKQCPHVFASLIPLFARQTPRALKRSLHAASHRLMVPSYRFTMFHL